jgi:hypothetical protein
MSFALARLGARAAYRRQQFPEATSRADSASLRTIESSNRTDRRIARIELGRTNHILEQALLSVVGIQRAPE